MDSIQIPFNLHTREILQLKRKKIKIRSDKFPMNIGSKTNAKNHLALFAFKYTFWGNFFPKSPIFTN